MRRATIVTILVLVSLLWSVSTAWAAKFKSGDTVIVAKGEVVNDDLYVAGGTLTISGTVNGDLVIAGGTIKVDGVVNGDLIAAGGSLDVSGKVSDDIRMAGGFLSLTGEVGDDAFVAGGSLDIGAKSIIKGDLVAAGGSVVVAGVVEGKANIGSGQVTISGTVKKDVEIEADTVVLEPTAKIEGTLKYTSEKEAQVKTGAQVMGTTTHQLPEEGVTAKMGIGGTIIDRLKWLVGPLVMGVILLLAFPRTATAIAATVADSFWKSLGMGAVVLIAAPIVALILAIITLFIGGLSLPMILMALYAVGIAICGVFVGLLIGTRILALWGRAGGAASFWPAFGALVLGLLILDVLTWIPYFIGGLVTLVVLLLGLGAITLWEMRAYSQARAGGRV